ncbi:MAG: tyrosine-type recombinase/integrase [Micavibrio sp.]
MKTKLTEKTVKNLEPPVKGYQIAYDDELKGFGVRVTYTGQKNFIFSYTIFGQERRFTIGPYPAWSVVAAREKAKELRRSVNNGQDPQELKTAERVAATVCDLYQDYKKVHLFKLAARNQRDIEAMWRAYILPALGKKRLKDLTGKDIDALHNEISLSHPVRANRVIANFRSALNLAVRWQLVDKNPATGFKRNPEEARESFLTVEQLINVFSHLDQMPFTQAANAIRMLVLTGARLNEVLKAQWDEFDLDGGRWTKPKLSVKTRKTQYIPISLELVALLQHIKMTNSTPYLFPNSDTGLPLYDIKRGWSYLKEAAQLEKGFRLHDLRHTYASILLSGGSSLEIIGRLLGHTQAQTTMRYAHLLDDPLRQATGKMGKILQNAQEQKDKIRFV